MREIVVTAASVFASYVIVIVIFVVIFFNVVKPYFDKRNRRKKTETDEQNRLRKDEQNRLRKTETDEQNRQRKTETDEQNRQRKTETDTLNEEGREGSSTAITNEQNRQRKTETDFCPSYWSKGGEEYRTIDITDDADFIKQMVYNLWDPEEVGKGRDAQEVGNNKYIKITNVERVENLPLFREYNHKRQNLLKKNEKIKRIKDLAELSGSGIQTTNFINDVPQLLDSPLEVDICHDINEHYLFHGTASENVESICREGLKIQYAGPGLFGKGIYAAEDPTKSDQYTDSRGNNGKKILLCRADLGEMYVANRRAEELKAPPCRTRACYKQNCKEHKYTFDSAVGDIPGHRYREFILYKDHRIYPEYIITYDRTDDPTEMMAYKSA